jgi:hypothetical protein
LTATLSQPEVIITETATLLPFPEITIQIPTVTGTDTLNYLAAPPGANGLPKGNLSIWVRLGRWWPLVMLLAFWLVLAGWFLGVHVLDRNRG